MSDKAGFLVSKTIAAPWSLGVAYFSTFPEHQFLFELLDHSGIAYALAEKSDDPSTLDPCRVWLVVTPDIPLPDNWAAAVRSHAEAGGGVVLLGNPQGLEGFLGVRAHSASGEIEKRYGRVHSIGEGYLLPAGDAEHWIPESKPLHFFGGLAIKSLECCRLLGDVTDHRRHPTGWIGGIRPSPNVAAFFIDIVRTIRHITHGIPVSVDGVPAPDGSAPINDNILKAEDGLVLDWTFDRTDPCDAGFPFFTRAIADEWRDLLFSAIFSVATAVSAPLKMLWLYPGALKALGHISFDTDRNDPDCAMELLGVLEEIDLRSTWMVIAPAWPEEAGVPDAIKAGGHEIGFHFNAGILPESRGSEWSFENFDAQRREVAAACQVDNFRSNKDHYTRWQNHTDIVEWCARVGILNDQSKLPSKPGTNGFFFGTCHPWLLHDTLGEAIQCLEIAGFTQDAVVTISSEAQIVLLKRAAAHNGVACYTFHPAHISKTGVRDALATLVSEGRALGLEWWTADEIACWEFARRSAAFNPDGLLKAPASRSGKVSTILTLDLDGDFDYLGASFKQESGPELGK